MISKSLRVSLITVTTQYERYSPHRRLTVCLVIDVGLQHLQLVSTKGSMKTVVALEPHVPTHWVMFTLVVDTQSPTFMSVGTTLCAQAAVSLGTEK